MDYLKRQLRGSFSIHGQVLLTSRQDLKIVRVKFEALKQFKYHEYLNGRINLCWSELIQKDIVTKNIGLIT